MMDDNETTEGEGAMGQDAIDDVFGGDDDASGGDDGMSLGDINDVTSDQKSADSNYDMGDAITAWLRVVKLWWLKISLA